MFKVEFAKSFLKDIKKLSPEAQREFFDKWLPKLQNDPSIGKKFVGKQLASYLKLAIRYKNNDYRVVYQVKKDLVLIILLAIGSRENFYKKLR